MRPPVCDDYADVKRVQQRYAALFGDASELVPYCMDYTASWITLAMSNPNVITSIASDVDEG